MRPLRRPSESLRLMANYCRRREAGCMYGHNVALHVLLRKQRCPGTHQRLYVRLRTYVDDPAQVASGLVLVHREQTR